MRKRYLFLIPIIAMAIMTGGAYAEEQTAEPAPTQPSSAGGIASSAYVRQIVSSLGVPAISEALTTHTSNVENPHAVTAAQVGLGNVKDVDNTNADNLLSGAVNIARLPVGSTEGTVAAGTDTRFDSVSITEPAGNPPDGRVYVWFN